MKKIYELLEGKLNSNEDKEKSIVKEEITITNYQKDLFLEDSKINNDIGKAKIKLDGKYDQRSILQLRTEIPGYKKEQLEKILVFAGGVRFYKKNKKEFWGLPQNNKSSMGFTKDNFPIHVLDEMKKKPKDIPKYLAKIILLNPKYRLRAFDTIKEKIKGFSDEELRGILKSIDAVALEGEITKKEFWALTSRN